MKTKNQNLVYWITIIVLFLFSLVFGFLGFQQYFSQHSEEYSWLRSAYRTIQIFTLENGDLREPIPWELHIVRFTAPLTAVLAFILALLEIFREQWKRFKIARMKNHVVIIGMGTKGKNVMAENINNGEKVLVIEKDPLNPHLASVRHSGCRIIIDNATNLNILKRARITRAKTVYLLMGDDSQQVRACLLIYQLIKESRRNKADPLDCIMHLMKQDYLITLRNNNLIQDINDGFSLSIFNIYENSARDLFQENPPDRTGISEQSNRYVQIIIFGFGQAGEALALQTALTGHYLNWKIRIPKIVVFDLLAEKKVRDFKSRYPAFTDYCDIESRPLEANSPQMIPELVKYLEEDEALNTIILCFDNKTQNMLLGLQIDNIDLNNAVRSFQTFIRIDDNESFISFSKNIKPYGLPSRVCSKQVIMDGNLDRMARGLHSLYLKIRRNEPDFGQKPADVPWGELSQEYKDSNKKAADHIGVKIRGIGYEIAGMDDPREPASFMEHKEKLAALEHRRWSAERSMDGWRYDPKKNDKTRKTPYLVDWSDLDEEIKKYDREAVENIPDVLKEVGFKIVKQN